MAALQEAGTAAAFADGMGVVAPPSRRERQIAVLITGVLAVYMLCEPLLTFYLLRTFPSGSGLPIRLYAAAYGLPLLAAALLATTIHGPRTRFPGSKALDVAAAALGGYWLLAIIIGLVLRNGPAQWISTSFNFQVPFLCYLAMRRLTHPELLDRMAARTARVALLAAPLTLLVTTYAVSSVKFVGAGGISNLLPVATGAQLIVGGARMAGWFSIAAAVVAIVLSLKRIVWAGLVLFPFVYLLVAGVTLRRVAQFVAGAALLTGLALIFGEYVPSIIDTEMILSRAESIGTETAGFTSGQAREDEVRSIWRATVVDGGPLKALLGLGTGGTYTLRTLTTYGEVLPGAHDSHFTPAGWLLRGGFLGVIITATFYVVAAGAGIASARRRLDPGARWRIAFVAFFLIAVFASVTSFSLTPNPVTHIILLAALQRSAYRHATGPAAA